MSTKKKKNAPGKPGSPLFPKGASETLPSDGSKSGEEAAKPLKGGGKVAAVVTKDFKLSHGEHPGTVFQFKESDRIEEDLFSNVAKMIDSGLYPIERP